MYNRQILYMCFNMHSFDKSKVKKKEKKKYINKIKDNMPKCFQSPNVIQLNCFSPEQNDLLNDKLTSLKKNSMFVLMNIFYILYKVWVFKDN